MTKIVQTHVTCFKCQFQNPFILYPTINTWITPEITERLIAFDLFQFECQSCGEGCHVDYPLLYHDMANHCLIQYVLTDKEIEKTKSNLKQVSDILSGPGDAPHFLTPDIIRVVSDREALIEKIQIVEAGLDDRLIEIQKQMVLAELEDTRISLSYDHLVFTKVGPEHYHFLFLYRNEAIASVECDMDLYDQLEDDYRFVYQDNTYQVDEKWAHHVIATS